MDFYQLFQASGLQATVIRMLESVDYATGEKGNSKIHASLPAAIVPVTWNLRHSRTEFVEANLIVLLDTYNKHEIPMWPIRFDDYVVMNRIAYRVTFTTEPHASCMMVALRTVQGVPPFNVTTVAA